MKTRSIEGGGTHSSASARPRNKNQVDAFIHYNGNNKNGKIHKNESFTTVLPKDNNDMALPKSSVFNLNNKRVFSLLHDHKYKTSTHLKTSISSASMPIDEKNQPISSFFQEQRVATCK